jgi:hypothetical protein
MRNPEWSPEEKSLYVTPEMGASDGHHKRQPAGSVPAPAQFMCFSLILPPATLERLRGRMAHA